jgi:hypothetical protein
MDTGIDRHHEPVVIDADAWVRTVVLAAITIEVALLALDVILNYYDLAGDRSVRRIFNIAREQSLPTFFASLQAVAVGVTALAVRATVTGRGERGGWLLAGVFWLYVGIDDNAEIHERVGSALRRATEDSDLVSWWPGFSWQLFLAPVLALGLFASVVVAWRFAERGRPLLIACLVCFALAQGIDVLEGIDDLFDDWAADADLAPYTVGHSFRATEEMLEMLGTTAYWWVVLTVLATRLRGRRVRVADAPAVSRPS